MMELAAPQPLPAEIRVEQLSPDEVRYILPRRPLGKYRWVALAPFLFGLLGLEFGWNLFTVLGRFPAQPIALIIAAVMAVFIGSAVLAPLALAAAMLFGHSSVEIRRGQLWFAEHVGPFRSRRRRPLSQVRKLLVSSAGNTSTSQGPAGTSPLARFAAIRIESVRGKPRMAAIGYPREWLVPLAHELARQAALVERGLTSEMPQAEPKIGVADEIEVADDSQPAERLRQPAGSRIVMNEQPGGPLAFEIPPAGIKGPARALFIFGVIWLAIVAVSSVVAIWQTFKQGQPPHWAGILGGAAFIGIFWLVGIGTIFGHLQMARRRAAIAVAAGRCMVIQTGLFGEKKRVWESGELSAVQVGPSGMEVNERPVMELQFVPRMGKKFGVLSAADVAELEWLATHLTKAIGLAMPRAGGAILADVDIQPPDSKVICQQRPGALTISIPRPAFFKGPIAIWIFAFIWNAFVTVFISLAWKDFAGPHFPMLFMGLFAVAGIGLIGVAIHITIQRAEIAVAGGRLLVVRYGLLGIRRSEWAADELAAVRAAASSTSVNNRRLMQLQIVPKDGKTLGLLTGRQDPELAWIATLLRRALAVPAEAEQAV